VLELEDSAGPLIYRNLSSQHIILRT